MGTLGPQLNADNVRVFGTGHFYIAPYGTTLPTTLTTNPASNFLDLGYISEDGVTIQPEVGVTEIMAWQSWSPVRIVGSSRVHRLTVPAMEMKDVTWVAAFGGGEWASVDSTTEVFTPAEAGTVTEWSGVFDRTDGLITYRDVYDRMVLTTVGEVGHGKTVPTILTLTFTVIGTEDGGAGWRTYRTKNDPDS